MVIDQSKEQKEYSPPMTNEFHKSRNWLLIISVLGFITGQMMDFFITVLFLATAFAKLSDYVLKTTTRQVACQEGTQRRKVFKSKKWTLP